MRPSNLDEKRDRVQESIGPRRLIGRSKAEFASDRSKNIPRGLRKPKPWDLQRRAKRRIRAVRARPFLSPQTLRSAGAGSERHTPTGTVEHTVPARSLAARTGSVPRAPHRSPRRTPSTATMATYATPAAAAPAGVSSLRARAGSPLRSKPLAAPKRGTRSRRAHPRARRTRARSVSPQSKRSTASPRPPPPSDARALPRRPTAGKPGARMKSRSPPRSSRPVHDRVRANRS